jgi:hypothetical protein
MEMLTAAQVAELLYPSGMERPAELLTEAEQASRQRSRTRAARAQLARWGVAAIPGVMGPGRCLLWGEAAVRAAIAAAPGKGNREPRSQDHGRCIGCGSAAATDDLCDACSTSVTEVPADSIV